MTSKGQKRLTIPKRSLMLGDSWLEGLLKGHISVENYPDDAEIVDAYEDYHHREIGFVVESEEFERVEEGETIPRLHLLVEDQ